MVDQWVRDHRAIRPEVVRVGVHVASFGEPRSLTSRRSLTAWRRWSTTRTPRRSSSTSAKEDVHFLLIMQINPRWGAEGGTCKAFPQSRAPILDLSAYYCWVRYGLNVKNEMLKSALEGRHAHVHRSRPSRGSGEIHFGTSIHCFWVSSSESSSFGRLLTLCVFCAWALL